MSQGWIAVDLDGTLARYDGWVSEEHIGEPIGPMLARVKDWLAEGIDVRIFTARVDGGEVALAMGNEAGERFKDVQRIRGFIEAWCLKQVIPNTGLTVLEHFMASARGVDSETDPACSPNTVAEANISGKRRRNNAKDDDGGTRTRY